MNKMYMHYKCLGIRLIYKKLKSVKLYKNWFIFLKLIEKKLNQNFDFFKKFFQEIPTRFQVAKIFKSKSYL